VIRGRRRRAEVSSIGNAVATAPTERSRGARSQGRLDLRDGQDVTDHQEMPPIESEHGRRRSDVRAAADSIVIIDRDLTSSSPVPRVNECTLSGMADEDTPDSTSSTRGPTVVEAALRKTFEIDEVTTVSFAPSRRRPRDHTRDARTRAARS